MLAKPLDPAVDLNGRWRVIHTVERSEVPRYVGLEIEFDVTISEDGERIRGEGEKFVVGWELVARAGFAPAARRPAAGSARAAVDR